MNFRLSIGGAWFEVHLFEAMMLESFLFFQIDYGYFSKNTFIRIFKSKHGRKIGTEIKFRGKIIKAAKENR